MNNKTELRKLLAGIVLFGSIGLLPACGGGGSSSTPPVTPPQSGSIDTTFGSNSAFNWGGISNDGGYDVIADTTGGYYVVGASGSSVPGAIWRLTSNGMLDATFNTSGVLMPVGASRFYRGIVTGGNLFTAGGTTTSGNIFCVTSSGALCSGFNNGNSLLTSTSSLAIASASNNGDILIAGGNGTSGWITSVTRASSAGVLGATYTSTGPLGTVGSNKAYGVAVDTSGNAYISGYAMVGAVSHGYVLKLTPAMTLDTSFSSSGSIPGVLDLGAGSGGSIVFDGTGKLLVANSSNLLSVTTAGGIDGTFASSGNLPAGFTIDKIAVDGNGKIILIGRAGTIVSACRYSSAGAIDTGFNTTGCHTYSSFVGPWGGTEIAGGTVDSSNRVLVTYPFNTNGTNLADVAVFRLTP